MSKCKRSMGYDIATLEASGTFAQARLAVHDEENQQLTSCAKMTDNSTGKPVSLKEAEARVTKIVEPKANAAVDVMKAAADEYQRFPFQCLIGEFVSQLRQSSRDIALLSATNDHRSLTMRYNQQVERMRAVADNAKARLELLRQDDERYAKKGRKTSYYKNALTCQSVTSQHPSTFDFPTVPPRNRSK